MANPRITPANANPQNQSARQTMNHGHQINARSNPGQSRGSVGQLSSYGVARNGIHQLHEGDIVRGEISDLRNNEITITLENNTLIKGEIADSSSLSIGQTAAFRMNSVSPAGLFMEVIPNSFTETELTLINKALEEAGLPSTPRNQSAVKALMDNLLPINKQSIQYLMQQAYDYGTEDMQTLCLMNKQHMNITRDSVIQFSNYRNQHHQILNQMESFSLELPQLLNALAENGPSNAVAGFGHQLISIALSGETNFSATPPDTIARLSSADLESLKEMLSETPMENSTKQTLENNTLSQRDALVLLRNAAAGGTLKLPAGISLAELTTKINEISQALQLPEVSVDSSVIEPKTTEPVSLPLPEDTTSDSSSESNMNPALSFAGKFLHNLSDAAKSSFQNMNQMLASASNSLHKNQLPAVMDTLLHSVSSHGLEDNALFTFLSSSDRIELSNALESLSASPKLLERVNSGEASTKEVFHAIQDLIPQADPSAVKDLFQMNVFQNLFTQAMMESFTITPKQLEKDQGMKEYYKKLENKLESFENLINSTLSGEDSQQLSGQAHDMKSNIDFMKALNETFSYMQLPLKLQNQNTHGDLYVYTQKEKLKQNPEKISLLLHLEMDHLGTLDVRLEKDKYNVDARFTLDDSEAMQLIQRNTHMLQNSLNEKGYTCNIQVDSGTPKENPVQDFLNTKVATASTHEMKRFSFDIRA